MEKRRRKCAYSVPASNKSTKSTELLNVHSLRLCLCALVIQLRAHCQASLIQIPALRLDF